VDLQEKPQGKLRTGFTTGTSATAASMAAILSIIDQKKIEFVDVLLPKKDKIKICINSCEFDKNKARCSVIKDGGDDPDVTHGAEIVIDLELTSKPNSIEIDGGEGVGRVTKPGIGLDIGQAAINPTPRKMITENLMRVGKKILEKNGMNVVISVPKGKELGPKTDNPRIGIVDGISILGTSGIVVPYSTASFAAAIRQQIDVVVSMGDDTVVLTTGGRSEDYARKTLELPEHSFIQMGDFAGYTISQCAKKNVKKAYVGGFIGKFAKMATGVKQTHVKGSKVNMEFLSELAKKCNANDNVIKKIKNANTARNVQEIVLENNIEGFFANLCSEVYKQMKIHSENKIPIEIILFDFDGGILGRHPNQ
jgi:cobalt-precorrin-5B (C1)-methyltransferase